MAVGQAFNVQFKPGDVIYGNSTSRIAYINSLPAGVADHLRSVGQYVICDEFNNRTFGVVPPTATSLNDYGVGQTPNSKAAINSNITHHQTTAAYLSPLQKAAVQEYYEALRGSKHSPLQAVKLNMPTILAKGNATKEDLAFRRACKFGLQFIIENRKGTVHFSLDVPAHYGVAGNRIDNLDVVTKQQHAGHVPITTSELRCIYRNRDAWCPQPGGANTRVRFYFNLIEVNPPWIDAPAVWAVYEAHRVMKGKA